MGHQAALEVWSITEGYGTGMQGRGSEDQGSGLEWLAFLDLHTYYLRHRKLQDQQIHLPASCYTWRKPKGRCKQEVILSNTSDSLKCRASSSSVRELCYLTITCLHCFCISKAECQAAETFQSFTRLWVSFPHVTQDAVMRKLEEKERTFSKSWLLHFLDSAWAGSGGFILCSDADTAKLKTPHDNLAKVLSWKFLSMISSIASSGF